MLREYKEFVLQMKFLIFLWFSVVKASHVMKPIKNSDVKGTYLDKVLPPNQESDLILALYCSQMINCNHVYRNETGVFFLSSITNIGPGTGTIYWKNSVELFQCRCCQ